MIQTDYSYFNINDGNLLSLEERIQQIMISIQKFGYIKFNDGKKCHNEVELRQVLKEKGIL